MKKTFKYLVLICFIFMATYALNNINNFSDIINILFLNIAEYNKYGLNSFSPQFYIFFIFIICSLLLDLFNDVHNHQGFIQLILVRLDKLKIIKRIFRELLSKICLNFLFLFIFLIIINFLKTNNLTLEISSLTYLLRLALLFLAIISNYILVKFLMIKGKESYYIFIVLFMILVDILFSTHLVSYSANLEHELLLSSIYLFISNWEFVIIILNRKRVEF